MIRLENVKKSLGGKEILKDITFHIPRGETMVILGPSGIGKSVTLKHIIGFLKPDSGKVFVDGKDVTNFSKADFEKLRERIGFVFQSNALINWLTLADNVALPLVEHTNLKKGEIKKIVNDTLSLFGLLDARDKFPQDLSGGMKKRGALARAIVREPELILYDEPTTGLDPVTANQINELIVDMKNRLRVTSIVVTHDIESACFVADKIAMMHDGRIIECGSPQEIKNSKNPIVKDFIEGKSTNTP